MKRNKISQSTLACLITGLLLTTLPLLLSRYFIIPDIAKGFLTGLGLTLEFLALVKIQRQKKEVCENTIGA